MDEIQKVLVKAGRKDLAQQYYLKTAQHRKLLRNIDEVKNSKEYKTLITKFHFNDITDEENKKKKITLESDETIPKRLRGEWDLISDDLVLNYYTHYDTWFFRRKGENPAKILLEVIHDEIKSDKEKNGKKTKKNKRTI